MTSSKTIELLEKYYTIYNQPNFIEDDPISIPHQFSKQQDIEISGFFAAILAWGQRKTIINKCNDLMNLMDKSPHDFIINHQPHDLKKFKDFKHRTFNYTDLLYFLYFFQWYYQKNKSLETAFLTNDRNIEDGLNQFRRLFFSLPDYPLRTQKHIAAPFKKSTCKRLNMFLRWMVRKDNKGVDFGIWEQLNSSSLFCPLDVHVERTARILGLIKRKQRDWKTVAELTNNLKQIDKEDPIRFDFALFGLGIEQKKGLSF